MSVPTQVVKLVEQFKDERQAVKSPQYKEAWGRVNYIDPLFKALGWDVHNEKSGTLIHKEVVHEDFLRVEGAMKAPDYCFYSGGVRKFFVEAKKPSVNLLDGKAAAFQVRRYAWSAKLPLSVLTDFEELAIYDCHFRPLKEDKASTARSLYMTYEEYPDRWDEIASLFSKEAVLSGSLDAYSQNLKKKRGVDTVDEAFLKEMERWREILAKDLTKRNPSLKRRELNYAVQMTIDRIVFLRICEDRGIEDYGNLEDLVGKDNVYGKLCDAFKDADDKYNSGLFHFREEKDRDEEPDDLTLSLELGDEPLKKIVKGLYYPESPYQFSVMPVEIMGQVYEQFLGKVISITTDHQVVIEEKPEVRKAGGVYYTPSYIVEYIVKNTVGKLLEGKTPKQVSKLKILDPACGSGSFLIGAYTHLLEWHRKWYVNDSSDKHAKILYEGPEGEWQLTTAEKKRILLNNIYGVDIDTQAVEVTKLSLLLKVLEGETNETINSQLTFFQERALPDLDNNIKWGNSLIGPDFYENEQMMLLDEEEHYRINVFDWRSAFPQVFSGNSPGFDAVLGNPPYGIVFDELIKPYLERSYVSFERNNDNYAAFTQRAVELLAADGLFGFIIPNTFLIGPYFNLLKRDILSSSHVEQIVDFGLHQVFPKPNVFTAILLLRKKVRISDPVNASTEFVKVLDLRSFPEAVRRQDIDTLVLDSLLWTPENPLVVKSFQMATTLDVVAWVKDVGFNYWTKGRGKKRGGSIATRILYKGETQHPQDKPYLKGRDIFRYEAGPTNQWLRHDYRNYLDPSVDTFRYSPEFLEREKIVYRQTADRIIATLERNKLLTDKTLHTIVIRDEWQEELDLRYLLGLLNSRFMTYLYQSLAQEEGRTFAQVKIFRMKQLPIRIIDQSDPEDKTYGDKIIKLVESMLALHEKLSAARTSQEKTSLQRRLEASDRQIDRLVYKLYGLTEDEIEIVEG